MAVTINGNGVVSSSQHLGTYYDIGLPQVVNARASTTLSTYQLSISFDMAMVYNPNDNSLIRWYGFSGQLSTDHAGANGYDTPSTMVPNGFIAIYVIVNPANNITAFLAANASTSKVPEYYAGAYMPAGFTHSALVGVLPLDGAAYMKAMTLVDRSVGLQAAAIQTGIVSSFTSNLTAMNLNNIVPQNCKYYEGYLITYQPANTPSVCQTEMMLASLPTSGVNGLGYLDLTNTFPPTGGGSNVYSSTKFKLDQVQANTLYYRYTCTPGVNATASLFITRYTI